MNAGVCVSVCVWMKRLAGVCNNLLLKPACRCVCVCVCVRESEFMPLCVVIKHQRGEVKSEGKTTLKSQYRLKHTHTDKERNGAHSG